MQTKIRLNNLRYNNIQYLHQIIRVNHAGEYGAMCIYYGQKIALKNTVLVQEIKEMEEQEKKHFWYFNKMLQEYEVRPSFLLPIWRTLGVSLGIITGLMGRSSTMTCTIAVEEVIEKHYAEQISKLNSGDLKDTISKFRAEELSHRDIAYIYNSKDSISSNKILSTFIKTSCKVAICLSKII
ncbi:demethoxyubiquinone hydroxylase family protein [Wolbachia endosymbiont of Howardula sp.]|uniref:demethoxyubiquinone hydroxylase family protein n=1 Tax=Wolbachia endosymbiont of Howardula sp. TaxID=2916816 RepID=UPI00217DBCEC|nr:demethoxyubiquinone hydroxylase family protein [Wolbachia endosymbiont of Howardula sp.]UWI83037.1 demethoxyubiquinone hydroxylase family protein [Wolbachia endosymbiont of Howardula sp.]